MKVLSTSLAITFAAQTCIAFTGPSSRVSFGVSQSRFSGITALDMAENKVPFFAKTAEEAPPTESEEVKEKDLNSMTLDEEVEKLVQEEVKKTKVISNLRNQNGVDYAPWMGISAEDEDKIRQIMKEKAEARRRRQEEEQNVSGNLYFDSQSQELSGTGLKTKIFDGDVELEWATSTEIDTEGFIVKRRPAKTDEFQVLASYKEWAPLVSQGEEGGVYRYLDTTATPGGWVYRVTECDKNGEMSDVCQCLVEVQTEGEQKAAKFAAIGIVAVGIAAVAAGLVLDPYAG